MKQDKFGFYLAVPMPNNIPFGPKHQIIRVRVGNTRKSRRTF